MLITIVALVVGGYVCLGLMLYFMQGRFLYQPAREIACRPIDIGMDFEDVMFETGDGVSLNAWFVPADDAEVTVLLCHGNGGNISHRLESIRIFNELGLNVFIFDYRGYGQSDGKPSEEGTAVDAMAAYEWLREKKRIAAEDIILFGRSLGGSVATILATKVEARALIVESSFTSFVDIGKKIYPYMPVGLVASFDYDTIGHIGKVDCPVMIVHSRDDEIIAFEFGERLYAAANEPKKFVEIRGGHNDGFIVSGESYKKAWREWLKSL